MRQFLSIGAMVVAAGLIAGCSSMSHNSSVASTNDSSYYNRGMAGGNGAFGENPQNPGDYSHATVAAHRQATENAPRSSD